MQVDENKLSGISSETTVQLADGRALPIRKIVNDKITGDVYTFDYQSGVIRPKKIIGWYKGPIIYDRNNWMHLTGSGYNKSNFTGGGFTKNFKIFTNYGTNDQAWKLAADLSKKDTLVSSYQAIINGSLGDFLWGLEAAVDCFRVSGQFVGKIRFIGIDNRFFNKWAYNLINPYISLKEMKRAKGTTYISENSFEIGRYMNEIQEYDPFTAFFMNHYSYLGLAILYSVNGELLSDNTIRIYCPYYQRYELDFNYLADIFTRKSSIPATGDNKHHCITLSTQSAYRLFDIIFRYVPNMYQKKLFKKFQKYYRTLHVDNAPGLIQTPVNILEIREASQKQMHNAHVFNLKIENSNNFFAGAKKNGFLVQAMN